MRTVAIIQAHMGSTRLPGKVLADIHGRTMIARVVERTRRSRRVEDVVLAATTHPQDAPLLEEATRLGVSVFRGSEQDVLDRYVRCAQESNADPVVRITSDCPLLDPELVDRVVDAFRSSPCDYASNLLDRTYPQGLDVEVVSGQALERAWREAREPWERVHVTPYINRHPDRFRLVGVRAEADFSRFRWTVDTSEDLAFVREVYARMAPRTDFGWKEVLALLGREPELLEINRHVRQKAPEEG